MRKWMRDRLQRRKKKTEEPGSQPAPPPLQPAYFEANESAKTEPKQVSRNRWRAPRPERKSRQSRCPKSLLRCKTEYGVDSETSEKPLTAWAWSSPPWWPRAWRTRTGTSSSAGIHSEGHSSSEPRRTPNQSRLSLRLRWSNLKWKLRQKSRPEKLPLPQQRFHRTGASSKGHRRAGDRTAGFGQEFLV